MLSCPPWQTLGPCIRGAARTRRPPSRGPEGDGAESGVREKVALLNRAARVPFFSPPPVRGPPGSGMGTYRCRTLERGVLPAQTKKPALAPYRGAARVLTIAWFGSGCPLPRPPSPERGLATDSIRKVDPGVKTPSSTGGLTGSRGCAWFPTPCVATMQGRRGEPPTAAGHRMAARGSSPAVRAAAFSARSRPSTRC